jgi:hypothetical protein
MLEERMEPGIRKWGFLLTEMVLIVASILFAFALDSWWDRRQLATEEREILLGLQEEFILNRSKLESRIVTHEINLLAVEQLLAATGEGHWNSKEVSPDQSLAALIAPPTTDLGNGVLSGLISGGRIELLSNKELRARLAAWEGVIAEVHDDEDMGRTMVLDLVLPYLIRNGVPVSGPMSTWPDNWSGPSRSVADDPDALARLLSDPQFSVILEVRLGYNHHTTGEYRMAMEAVERILDEIRVSLADS